MDYLFIRYGENHIVSDDEDDDNIDHVLELYTKLFPDWEMVAFGNDLCTLRDYYQYTFFTFIETWELIDNDGFFNPLFYEMEDGLLQKLINYYHTGYIMEEMEPNEIAAYKILMVDGPKSIRKNIIFEPKGKSKKK